MSVEAMGIKEKNVEKRKWQEETPNDFQHSVLRERKIRP